jgi:cobalamin synthase
MVSINETMMSTKRRISFSNAVVRILGWLMSLAIWPNTAWLLAVTTHNTEGASGDTAGSLQAYTRGF